MFLKFTEFFSFFDGMMYNTVLLLYCSNTTQTSLRAVVQSTFSSRIDAQAHAASLLDLQASASEQDIDAEMMGTQIQRFY